MRILMLTQFYPPIIGGEQQHVRNLSRALVARGHDVAVVTHWHTGDQTFEMDHGVRIHRIRGSLQRMSGLFTEKGGTQHAPPFPDPEAMLALRQILRQERPDVVHAHNWLVHSFTPLKKWSKAKLVVTLHDFSLVCATKRFMEQKKVLCSGPGLQKCLACSANHYGPLKGTVTTAANWFWKSVEYRAVDMFLPVSLAVAEGTQLQEHRAPYRVVPNFIPDDVDERYDDEHPLLKDLPDQGYLLYVGDLCYDKGVGVLLQAHAELQAPPPLVLIGRPVGDVPIDKRDNIIALHSWPHQAVMSAWRRSAIALAPSLCADACPTVVMEAMSVGRPVIGSRVGGIPDIISNGETGFLVTPGDVHALREKMQKLLVNNELRKRMGDLSKERISAFQAKTVVPRIEGIYHEVMQS